MAQPQGYSLVNNVDPNQAIARKAAIRHQFLLSALAGACSANNGSAALYTPAQAAAYAIQCSDALVSALQAEG